MNNDTSFLELFPDELFLELFSFIKPIDLYRGFVNLNQRINNILNDTHLCMHIINDVEHEVDQACMIYFARQIIYLAIDCHFSTLSYDISLRSFVNLRSLHLPLPSVNQCLEITPNNLPYLTNLTINDKIFKSILCNLDPFPYLSTCCIPRVYPRNFSLMEPSQLCLTIRSLNLCSCSINHLLDILAYLPNLNYLEIVVLPNKEIIRQCDIKHNNISHLKVKLRKLDPDLEILLKSMPNIHRLEFLWHQAHQDYHGRKSFNFKRFSDILEKNPGSLKRIDIDIHVSKYDYDIDSIHNLNLQWFSSLNKLLIFSDDSVLITTQRLSSNPQEKLITDLLQSSYMTERNARFKRIENL
ncbi:unnamed protein product [Adineta steineri]|uniref:F-box domain-containing protein n=1 Tax=Adineta steineri TaxID=433720 RepID=A0A815IXN1_9BILA|nr:unnamed protein product [Adineta steineri]CAF1604265.1 unnamed protein product [Adineta steineri]